MKKIALFVSMLVLGFSFGLNAFAQEQEYKVGDKMPNYKLGTFLEREGLATTPADRLNCQIFFQLYSLRNSDSDSVEYSVAFPSSEPTKLPFGIFHGPTKTLYLDNKDATGGNGPDGRIDEIDKNPVDRDALNDHPFCNKK